MYIPFRQFEHTGGLVGHLWDEKDKDNIIHFKVQRLVKSLWWFFSTKNGLSLWLWKTEQSFWCGSTYLVNVSSNICFQIINTFIINYMHVINKINEFYIVWLTHIFSFCNYKLNGLIFILCWIISYSFFSYNIFNYFGR